MRGLAGQVGMKGERDAETTTRKQGGATRSAREALARLGMRSHGLVVALQS